MTLVSAAYVQVGQTVIGTGIATGSTVVSISGTCRARTTYNSFRYLQYFQRVKFILIYHYQRVYRFRPGL